MTATSTSLRTRLFVTILAPLLLVSVLLSIWRYHAAQVTAETLFDRGLLSAALAIARDVAISEGDALSPRTRALISDAGGGEVFYHVTGPGGIYVTGYAYPPRAAEPMSERGPLYLMAEYRGEPVRVLRMSERTIIGNLTGDTVVTVWQRLSDRADWAAQLAWRAAALIAVLMATLAVVVWFGVQLGLRPLRGLLAAIDRRSPDDLSPIRRPVPTELSSIVATLNRLFAQVERSLEAHQAFISDAAHQLRNPAAALLSLAETLPEVQDPEERRRREQELITGARKSARLANQLLSLERLRYDSPAAAETFDLSDVAEQVGTDMAPDLLHRDIAFSFDRSTVPLPVAGDPVLIGEALRNLIDNALRHGGPDLTAIRVETALIGDQASLTVADNGRGMRPGDVSVAFRRFGQLDPGAGSGLGLPIVKEVARLHGGDIRMEPSETGATLGFHLPIRSQNAA
ncbi:sensor histidine kinase N-terminal domain-containing protein [Marinovum sp.]|uniref:sensor histidine kinase N-terminal domain-containing protein n=1 Tax=Marinovum sp. TaxID=2024839 RepID=UPI003A91BA11